MLAGLHCSAAALSAVYPVTSPYSRTLSAVSRAARSTLHNSPALGRSGRTAIITIIPFINTVNIPNTLFCVLRIQGQHSSANEELIKSINDLIFISSNVYLFNNPEYFKRW